MTDHPSDNDLIRELQAFADDAAARVPETTPATAWIKASYNSSESLPEEDGDPGDRTIVEMPLPGRSPLPGGSTTSLGAGQIWWAGAAAALVLILALGTTLILRSSSEQVNVANQQETPAADNGALDDGELNDAVEAESDSDDLTFTRDTGNRRPAPVDADPSFDPAEVGEDADLKKPADPADRDSDPDEADPEVSAGEVDDDASSEAAVEPDDADPDHGEATESQVAEPEPLVVADPTPTSTPRPTPTGTPTPVPTSTPRPTPTGTPTPWPTSTPQPTPTSTPRPTPTPTPTPWPTATSTPTPSPTPFGALAPGNPEIFVEVCSIDVSADGVPRVSWTPVDARVTQIFRSDHVALPFDFDELGQRIAQSAYSVNGFVDETARVGATYRYTLVQYLETPGGGEFKYPCNLVHVTPKQTDSSSTTVQVFQDDLTELPPNISMKRIEATGPDNTVVAHGLLRDDGVAHLQIPLETPSFWLRVNFEDERDDSCRWRGGMQATNRPIAQQFEIRLFSVCN